MTEMEKIADILKDMPTNVPAEYYCLTPNRSFTGWTVPAPSFSGHPPKIPLLDQGQKLRTRAREMQGHTHAGLAVEKAVEAKDAGLGRLFAL